MTTQDQSATTTRAPAHVKMTPVRSSNIEAVGYDAPKQTLHITFKDGEHYSYDGVLPETHTLMHSAASAGKFFHEHVKGKYPHRKH